VKTQGVPREKVAEFQHSLFLCDYSYEDNLCKKIGNTQFILQRSDGKLFISFAGTESLADVFLVDLKIGQSALPYGNKKSKIRIYKGFLNEYLLVRHYILTEVIAFVREERTDDVFISGHSSGGALALLAALDIDYALGLNPWCFTFGQPKTGNLAFVRSTNARLTRYFRFVNGSDLVTKAPFRKYRHCGQLVEIGKKSVLRCLLDHKLDNYIEVIFHEN